MTREFALNGCKLINADCFDAMSEIADGSVDCVITDMPYASSFGRCTSLNFDKKPIDHEQFWHQVERITKPSAPVVCFANLRLAHDLISTSRDRWTFYDLVWSKNNKCGFLWAKHQPLRGHEHILVFTRKGEFRNACYSPMMLPSGRIGSRRITRKQTSVYGKVNTYTSVSNGMMHPCSVLQFDNDRRGNQRCYHSTQKPLKLLQWLVATYSREGNTVLDPFAGSFTTALACMALGRKCIAIEKEEKYFSVGVERLKSAWHSNMFIGGMDDNVSTIAIPRVEVENADSVIHSPAV